MRASNQYLIKDNYIIEQLVSPNKLTELYPNLYSEKELKSLIKNRRYNGLNTAVHKIPGRKLMISIPDFQEWVQSRMSKD